MTGKSLKFGNKIIVFALILLTSIFFLALYFTLDRPPVSAIIDGTTQTRLTENLYDTNGNLVSSAIVSLLNSISYLEHLNDMGTYEAHQIVSRNNDDDYSGDNTIVFPMGYYVDSSGNMDTSKPLYWQVVYLNNNYLTIWLDKGYTMAYYNRNGTPKNGFDPGNDYSSNSNYYSNYSKSQLRDTALNIFSLLSNNLNNFEQIIVSPNIAANKTDGTNW